MKISGKIVDSNQEPLALANITLLSGDKAGKTGTISGVDGDFFLDSDTISPDSEFAVSYVGFVTQKLNTNQLNNKTVVLLESIEQLNEVTVFTRPKVMSATKTNTIKNNFTEHLSKHKFVYTGIGGLVGLALIFTSIKKL